MRLGARRALLLARLLHVLMVVLLLAVAVGGGLGVVFQFGVLVTTGLLAWEHRFVRADDLSCLNKAFFTMNGVISVLLFLFALVDVLIRFKKGVVAGIGAAGFDKRFCVCRRF